MAPSGVHVSSLASRENRSTDFGAQSSLMRRRSWLLFLCLLANACVVPFLRRGGLSPCERQPSDEHDEPVYAFARSLLTDSTWASLRQKFDLRGSPADVRWVGDPATCRRLADAFAASGRPADYSQPLDAVSIGRFYVVRRGLGGEWLIGPDFRLRTVFVVPE